jgi:hypothetical protein
LRVAVQVSCSGSFLASSAQRLWFVVDELDALGTIDGLRNLRAKVLVALREGAVVR